MFPLPSLLRTAAVYRSDWHRPSRRLRLTGSQDGVYAILWYGRGALTRSAYAVYHSVLGRVRLLSRGARSRMAVSRRSVRVTVITFLLCTSTACLPIGKRGANLQPAVRGFAPDIPVPRGFELVERTSEEWSDGLSRYLRHRYSGQADKYAVREFYRRQMPLARWMLVSDENIHGRIAMHFRRAQESCTIYIEGSHAALSRGVRVDVLVTPDREGAAARSG